MTELPNTKESKELVQEFIDKTKEMINDGAELIISRKAQNELQDLMLDFDIEFEDIEDAILNLSPDNYYRGIDLTGRADYDICAFRCFIGESNTEIYLKYGISKRGIDILIFSNHPPNFPMNEPFAN
jgi:hypothetical protein